MFQSHVVIIIYSVIIMKLLQKLHFLFVFENSAYAQNCTTYSITLKWYYKRKHLKNVTLCAEQKRRYICDIASSRYTKTFWLEKKLQIFFRLGLSLIIGDFSFKIFQFSCSVFGLGISIDYMTIQLYLFFFIISLWNISTDSTLLFRAQIGTIALQLAINVSALVTIVPFYSFFKNVSEFSMLLLPILYSLPIEKKLKLISNPKNAKTLTNLDGIYFHIGGYYRYMKT